MPESLAHEAPIGVIPAELVTLLGMLGTLRLQVDQLPQHALGLITITQSS